MKNVRLGKEMWGSHQQLKYVYNGLDLVSSESIQMAGLNLETRLQSDIDNHRNLQEV